VRSRYTGRYFLVINWIRSMESYFIGEQLVRGVNCCCLAMIREREGENVDLLFCHQRIKFIILHFLR